MIDYQITDVVDHSVMKLDVLDLISNMPSTEIETRGYFGKHKSVISNSNWDDYTETIADCNGACIVDIDCTPFGYNNTINWTLENTQGIDGWNGGVCNGEAELDECGNCTGGYTYCTSVQNDGGVSTSC